MFFDTLGEVAYNIILPLFLVIGIVMLVDYIFEIDPRPMSRLVIYLFTPFLIFEQLATTELTAGEAGGLIGVAVGMSLLIAALATIVAGWLRLDRRTGSAFVLTATLVNAGNYGLPLNRFAFGAAGEARAVVFFVSTVLVTYTLGVFLASRGNLPTRDALLNILRVPLVYAALAGITLNVANIEMPTPIARTTGLLAQAAVPAMLVVLGLQLRRAELKGHIAPILAASGLRLLVAPVIGLLLALLLGISGLTRNVAVIQSAMPTAVISSILAMEFGADTEFVAGAILVSTILSMLTLSVALTLML